MLKRASRQHPRAICEEWRQKAEAAIGRWLRRSEERG
jgi:hypothetical protein